MKPTLSIGTKGFATRSFLYTGISKGDEVTIIGIDEEVPSRGYDLKKGLEVVRETGFDSVIPYSEILPVGARGIAGSSSRGIQKGDKVRIVAFEKEYLEYQVENEKGDTAFLSVRSVTPFKRRW